MPDPVNALFTVKRSFSNKRDIKKRTPHQFWWGVLFSRQGDSNI